MYTTRHPANEKGACELPNADYGILTPVALGDIAELGYLGFKPDLCGHILKINCGHGDMDIIITNSNLGGGLDLYASSWSQATNNLPPGIIHCDVQLTSQNPIRNSSPTCYYMQNEGQNPYYHNVALFNTGSRIVTGAVLKNINGEHRGEISKKVLFTFFLENNNNDCFVEGNNPYYAFNTLATDDDQVVFSLNDGTIQSFSLKNCVKGVKAKENWS